MTGNVAYGNLRGLPAQIYLITGARGRPKAIELTITDLGEPPHLLLDTTSRPVPAQEGVVHVDEFYQGGRVRKVRVTPTPGKYFPQTIEEATDLFRSIYGTDFQEPEFLSGEQIRWLESNTPRT